VGWSLGGTIAVEMVAQLEREGETVAFLGLIDSVPPYGDLHKELPGEAGEFNLESELAIIREHSIGGEIEEMLKNVVEPGRFWSLVVDYLETGNYDVETIKRAVVEYGMQALPNYDRLNIRDCVYYLNVGRTFRRALVSYRPPGRLNTAGYFFKALQPPFDHHLWDAYFRQPLKCFQIAGDHYSVFHPSHVVSFARTFNRILKKRSTSAFAAKIS
jgi:thioesterase domain-containing protein